ncbi:MAG: hypothetical protein MRZ79_20565 [Bacteroidia bacterium]|nr:hypothetical protein [Bacteroidia bacterium]
MWRRRELREYAVVGLEGQGVKDKKAFVAIWQLFLAKLSLVQNFRIGQKSGDWVEHSVIFPGE